MDYEQLEQLRLEAIEIASGNLNIQPTQLHLIVLLEEIANLRTQLQLSEIYEHPSI